MQVGAAPRATAARLTDETAAQQSRAVLYQPIDAACVDLDFNCEKRQRGAKKAKMFLPSLLLFAFFASPLVCNEQCDLIWFVLAV
jgi:hypothetical protein